jgi:hypothetical protein
MSFTRQFRRFSVTLAALLGAALATPPPSSADTTASPRSPASCSAAESGHGVTIQSCAFTLEASPGGNQDYFVNVTIKYTAPNPTMAVRFRCALGNGSTTVSQYGVLRSSSTSLKFVSPFVSPSAGVLKSVACYVDAT